MTQVPNTAAASASRSTSPNSCTNRLRPDLAAFFALSSRELAPHRLIHEHGVLAELRHHPSWD
jgi:hypothetical protein